MVNEIKKKKHHQKAQSLKGDQMEVELGSEWTGDAQRVAEKVETRVKTTASRYGFCENEDDN